MIQKHLLTPLDAEVSCETCLAPPISRRGKWRVGGLAGERIESGVVIISKFSKYVPHCFSLVSHFFGSPLCQWYPREFVF